jgi:hypothetical protein
MRFAPAIGQRIRRLEQKGPDAQVLAYVTTARQIFGPGRLKSASCRAKAPPKKICTGTFRANKIKSKVAYVAPRRAEIS